MNIGQAVQASGVSAKMIRYYEETGLIPPADRTASGYRSYGPSDVHRLRFICRARDLGFTVEGIAELLGLWSDRDRQSANVKHFALEHVVRLREKISALESMVATLESLADCYTGDDRPDCPILRDLKGVPAGPVQRQVLHFRPALTRPGPSPAPARPRPHVHLGPAGGSP